MKVFVFGAGASKGAQLADLPEQYRAPLANELFDRQYQDYAKQTLLPIDLMEEGRLAGTNASSSVEKWLTEKWAKIPNYKTGRTQHTERASFGHLTFYVWRLLQQVSSIDKPNKYSEFMKKLTARDRDENFGLISFNYDTMLDQAITEHAKISLGTLKGYKIANYVKPHGSVNWFIKPRTDDPPPPKEHNFDLPARINLAAENMFNGSALSMENLEILNPSNPDLMNQKNLEQLFRMFDNRYFYPMVLVPLLTKLYPHISKLNDFIMSEGERILSNATEIYLIGYQASDEIIFEMMQDVRFGTLLHIVGVNSGSINNTMTRVMGHSLIKGKLKEGKRYQVGFAGFVDSVDF